MASLRIILDPEAEGIGEGFARAVADRSIIHLTDDAEVVVSGLKDGMQSGNPSVMFGFALPDGQHVIYETSWRLFAMAFWAFAEKFGTEKPDATGMALEYDATGADQRVRIDLVGEDTRPFFACELCGERFEPTEEDHQEASVKVTQFIHRHYREKHPGWSAPTA